ncbi:unnamed protein product [Ectocarpus sp. CCAP 1310/34]|nr:unnamed protein product [Ectocarpus sp. CCAP 1310/34]
MDSSVETTTTLRGRHTKVPAKYQHNGSLGAAVGGGGLLERVERSWQQRGGRVSGKDHASQSSLNRNRNKSYNKWSAYLLREACALRTLTGNSRSNDTDKMAAGLTQLDIMSRSSPYLADLEDKATGGTPPSKPPASSAEAQRVPQDLITAVRAAIRSGLSPEPNKMYDCDGKSYTVAAIMAAIKEEDRADGRGEGIGQRRKSKHCLSKKELDAKQKGTTRDIHLEIWEAFKDEKFNVSVQPYRGTPPSKPPASSAEAQRVPQDLITAVRAAIRSGLSPEPNKMYDCDGKSYTVAAIMAAIKEEDRADGRGEGIGQRRKSKHCLSKKELDAKQKGTTRDIHLEIWEAFKDEKYEVRCFLKKICMFQFDLGAVAVVFSVVACTRGTFL